MRNQMYHKQVAPTSGIGGMVMLLLVMMASSLAAGDEGPQGRAVAGRRATIVITPDRVELGGPGASRQVLVTAIDRDGAKTDLTHLARWESSLPVFDVDHRGLVTARQDGTASLTVRVGGRSWAIEVVAGGTADEHPVSFQRQIVPLLSSLGCSDIRCHGAPSGKGGFRLSLWGSDNDFDHQQLVRDAFGRRTNGIRPDQSLLLRKPMMKIPHVGGKRFEQDSHAAELLRRWQAEGLVHDRQSPGLARLQVMPDQRVLQAPSMQQQLAVQATYVDHQSEDVTGITTYQSSDLAIADVDQRGRVVFHQQGEVAILCRYMGQLVSVRMIHIAQPRPGYRWPDPGVNNFVDEHVFAKLRLLNIAPSELCSDAEFIRRVTLDLCGLLPTPSETAAFVASGNSDKRERLVDELLHRSEFTDFWTKKWLDVLRVSRDSIQFQGAQVFQAWMRDQIRQDRPLTEIVGAMLMSQGESYKDPPTNFFCVAPMPREVTDVDYLQKDLAESTAQLFLGIRLQCAQCHNHPFERWTQDDYLGLAAFFSQVKRSRLGKEGPSGRPDRRQIAVQLDPAISRLAGEGNRDVAPHFPGQSPRQIDDNTDLRSVLVTWITGPDNPFFARSLVNRVWYHLHGRGIVEPVDDFRDSNPSVNDELLAALAGHFIDNNFQLKPLVRVIVQSRAYQLSSAPNDHNRADARYFSHHFARPLPAEVLLDAICEVTGVPEQYEVMQDYLVGIPTESLKLPIGTRAVQLPVTDLVTLINSSGKYVRYELHPFLRTFGQPVRRETCECDRSTGFNRKQALELTVGSLVAEKLSATSGRLPAMLAAGASDRQVLLELYQRALSRHPSAEAAENFLGHVQQSSNRQQAWEDILWTLLNSKEFIYQH